MGDLNSRIIETVLTHAEKAIDPPHLCDFRIQSVLETQGREKRLRWFTVAGYHERCRVDGLADLPDQRDFSHPELAGGFSILESTGFYETPAAFEAYANGMNTSSRDQKPNQTTGRPASYTKQARAIAAMEVAVAEGRAPLHELEALRAEPPRKRGRPPGPSKTVKKPKLASAHRDTSALIEEETDSGSIDGQKQKGKRSRKRKATEAIEGQQHRGLTQQPKTKKQKGKVQDAEKSTTGLTSEIDELEEQQQSDVESQETDKATTMPKKKKPKRAQDPGPNGTPPPQPVRGRPRKYPLGTTNFQRVKLLAERREAGLEPPSKKPAKSKVNGGMQGIPSAIAGEGSGTIQSSPAGASIGPTMSGLGTPNTVSDLAQNGDSDVLQKVSNENHTIPLKKRRGRPRKYPRPGEALTSMPVLEQVDLSSGASRLPENLSKEESTGQAKLNAEAEIAVSAEDYKKLDAPPTEAMRQTRPKDAAETNTPVQKRGRSRKQPLPEVAKPAQDIAVPSPAHSSVYHEILDLLSIAGAEQPGSDLQAGLLPALGSSLSPDSGFPPITTLKDPLPLPSGIAHVATFDFAKKVNQPDTPSIESAVLPTILQEKKLSDQSSPKRPRRKPRDVPIPDEADNVAAPAESAAIVPLNTAPISSHKSRISADATDSNQPTNALAIEQREQVEEEEAPPQFQPDKTSMDQPTEKDSTISSLQQATADETVPTEPSALKSVSVDGTSSEIQPVETTHPAPNDGIAPEFQGPEMPLVGKSKKGGEKSRTRPRIVPKGKSALLSE